MYINLPMANIYNFLSLKVDLGHPLIYCPQLGLCKEKRTKNLTNSYFTYLYLIIDRINKHLLWG